MPSNPNFDSTHCQTSHEEDVPHWHFQRNYKSYFPDIGVGIILESEGNAYFDYVYGLFDPAPDRGIGLPTNVTNCVCFAYHKYWDPTTTANYWVNAIEADLYRAEVILIKGGEGGALKGDNGDYETVAGDRCDTLDEHVWVIGCRCESLGHGAHTIVWKDGASAVYTWEHNEGEETNDAPQIWDPRSTSLWEEYAIYNREPR